MNKHGAKKDANHKELVTALKELSVQVIDTSQLGGGFPDLICCVRRETLLVEIKNTNTGYGRRGLNKNQKEFAESWTGGPIYVIKNLDDVESLANGRLDKLYAYGGYNLVNVAV
jgi:Holliday junction resolvase